MIPSHASMPLEQLERKLCAAVLHRPVIESRGSPVTEFLFCVRCGKIISRIVDGALLG